MFKKIALVVLAVVLSACSNNGVQEGSVSENIRLENTIINDSSVKINAERVLTPAENISHVHGVSVDPNDDSKLYIATHNGLFLLENDSELFKVGNSSDDFMGFSAHPTLSEKFYASGHPKTGGNLGVLESNDSGQTWDMISMGLDRPVDFHAMEINIADANVLYGFYGELMKSLDAGKTWNVVSTPFSQVISLVSDSQDANVLFANTQFGTFVSRDQSDNWSLLSPQLESVMVSDMAIARENNKQMLSFSKELGLARSLDGGVSWNSLESDLGIVTKFAESTKNSNTVYAITMDSKIFKSIDFGDNWTQVL